MDAAAAERALPTLSLAERDRRWALVRKLMAEHGIDVLVAPPNTAHNEKFQADARYLTQFGLCGEEIGCVFPLHGPAIGFGGPSTILAAGWLDDVRPIPRRYGAALIQGLRDVGAERATIGICGLERTHIAYVHATDSVVGYQFVEKLRRALPRARLVDGTMVTGEARIVKSDEEIACLERALQLAEAGLAAHIATARPGLKESACIAAIIAAEVERGGDLPVRLEWWSGPPGEVYPMLTHATQREIRDGDVLVPRIEGRWAGYLAQLHQPTFVGRVPDECRDGWAVALDAYDRAVEAIKPGVTYGEVLRAGDATPVVGGWTGRLVLEGIGLGDDGPLMTARPFDPEMLARPIQVGNTFAVKPSNDRDGYSTSIRFGDCVVVTPTGTRRLGTRPRVIDAYVLAAR